MRVVTKVVGDLARRDAPQVPSVIERFVKALVVTVKAVGLYPPASNIPLDTARDALKVLSEVLAERSELRLNVTKDGLFYYELPVYPGVAAYESFAFELYNRKLAEVRFHAGAEPRDIVSFATLVVSSPDDIEMSGGFEARLFEMGVAAITVKNASITLVDSQAAATPETDEDLPPMARVDLDEVLSAAHGGRVRDQVTIARFIHDTEAVSAYLSDTFTAGGVAGLVDAGERFSELAAVAAGSDPENRLELLRDLGESLEGLDPSLRRPLLMDELLPDARADESVAEVIRQLDIDDVCRMLVSDLDDSTVSREGLARAIRTLAMISTADRAEVAKGAEDAMREAGFSEGVVSEIGAMSAPSRLTVREGTAAGASDKPADAIFRLMDLAPTPSHADQSDDPEIAALAEEAARGITDGDIIMALVTLVSLDPRETQFATTAAMLEDSLDVLIERGEIEIAADSCDALLLAAQNEDLTEAQRERLRQAIGRFTKPADIRAMAQALRLYKPGSPEYEAANRLLDSLGSLTIDPLLEQLADETDMSVRKSLIELLSGLAPNYIGELGRHMGDSRWYVVRNVVNILGTTRSSAVIPYLERTLRHPDPRVRREAIRALAGIADRLAESMLISSLGDADAQNVQLAARYLGTGNVVAAIPALEQLARGEGRGNHETGPRAEAIEALGKMKAVQALPTLESLAGKRSIMGGGRARELRAAAESAIARIKSGGGA